MKKKAIALSVGLLALVSIITLIPQSRGIFCFLPINPELLDRSVTLNVPEEEQRTYIARLRRVFEEEGMWEDSREQYLRGPDNEHYRYTIKTYVGCNGSATIFSSNDRNSTEFLVTFYHNRLFDRSRVLSAEKTFFEEFDGAFSIEDYNFEDTNTQ